MKHKMMPIFLSGNPRNPVAVVSNHTEPGIKLMQKIDFYVQKLRGVKFIFQSLREQNAVVPCWMPSNTIDERLSESTKSEAWVGIATSRMRSTGTNARPE